jgi:hypothetical protein
MGNISHPRESDGSIMDEQVWRGQYDPEAQVIRLCSSSQELVHQQEVVVLTPQKYRELVGCRDYVEYRLARHQRTAAE